MKNLLKFTILFLIFGMTITCQKENEPPVIQSTTASPQTIKTGETSQLTSVATDPEGDQLTYSWSSTKGIFPNGTSGSSVSWKAPDEANTYTISVTVNDGKTIADGQVNVTVEANPQLVVTPSNLEFGSEDIEKTFDIKNSGTGALTWSVTESLDWLTISTQSGETTTETDNITVTINRSGISPGNYSGKITVSSNDGSQEINVTMTVEEQNTGTFTDSRDGNTYKWVKIGDQVWMGENLAYLPAVSPSLNDSYTDPYYYVYGYQGTDVEDAKATNNYKTYGVLYNYSAAISSCPDGWHLPSNEEWEQLASYISNQKGPYSKSEDGWDWHNVGNHLKAINGWGNNGNGTDDFGFHGLPSGNCYDGAFSELGTVGGWWSYPKDGNYETWFRFLHSSKKTFYKYINETRTGYNVRCVRD